MNFLKQAPNLYNQLISGWEGGGGAKCQDFDEYLINSHELGDLEPRQRHLNAALC